MEYKDLEKVNNELTGIDVKGKEYVEVNKRILAFRKLYPEGTIATELVSVDNGVCIIKAKIFIGDLLLATGFAYEKEGSSFINKTSYIENCETSAVGRALGMLGIGIDTSVASAEEVQNAILQQKADEVIPETHHTALIKAIENKGITDMEVSEILHKYGYSVTNEIKLKDYKAICDDFSKLTKKISDI